MQVCRASHRSRAFEGLRSTYGQSSVGKDGTLSGWLTDDGSSLQRLVNPYSLDWRTAHMQVCISHITANQISDSYVTLASWLTTSELQKPPYRCRHPSLAVWTSLSATHGCACRLAMLSSCTQTSCTCRRQTSVAASGSAATPGGSHALTPGTPASGSGTLQLGECSVLTAQRRLDELCIDRGMQNRLNSRTTNSVI